MVDNMMSGSQFNNFICQQELQNCINIIFKIELILNSFYGYYKKRIAFTFFFNLFWCFLLILISDL